MKETSDNSLEPKDTFEALVDDIVAGRVSMMDVMRSAPAGDYFAFVQQLRLSRMLMADRRVLDRLMIEMRERMIEAGVDPGNPSVEKNHRKKHFVSVMSGALINARLDRILGKDAVRRVLHEAESDELEKTRQRCLYIDIESGRAITPTARITELRARELTILAGELMTEILGHFPWEFERMIENVISFERSIGLSEKTISRR